MMIPWLICPKFYGFFVDFCGWIQLYFDGSSVFFSRDNEEISMLYLYVLVVKFTTMNFKVYVYLHEAFILIWVWLHLHYTIMIQFLTFETHLYPYGYDWRLSWSIIRLSKTSLYFLFWEIVFMVFDVVHLVILYGLSSVNIHSSSLSGFSISFNTKSFILAKWSMFWPRTFRVNPLTLHVCFPCFVLKA